MEILKLLLSSVKLKIVSRKQKFEKFRYKWLKLELIMNNYYQIFTI